MKLSTTILRSTAPLAFAVMGLHALGCMVGPSESGLTEEDFLGNAELGIAGDPGTSNHYNLDCFWDHGIQQTFRDLAAGPIVDENGELPEMPYMPEEASGTWAVCRATMLELLVDCALNSSAQAIDTFDTRHYPGSRGYASAWTTRGLTTDEKERVTACMLQRLNPHGVVIPILLESPSAPNTTTDYPLHESEAWGNLFDSTVTLHPTPNHVPPTTAAFAAYACKIGEMPTYCDEGSIIPWNLDYTMMRTCYYNDNACRWIAIGACPTSCPTALGTAGCEAWDNRLRVRGRDDGSLCGASTE